MTLKRTFVRQLVLLSGVLLVFSASFAVAPAGAQQGPGNGNGNGYPGTTQPPGNSGPARERRAHVLSANESRTFEDCGFRPGSGASLTFNGTDAGTDVAENDGCVRVDVKASSASRCSLTINGREFAARGSNELVVDGTGSNGAPRSVAHDITLNCGGERARDLPRTGSSMAGWVLIAMALIAVGAVAVQVERRKLARR